jgi:hypothetical protein
MKKIFFLLTFTVAIATNLFAQDMLDAVEDKNLPKEYVTNAFKSSRVINNHSMEFIGKGVLDFRILHRFGVAKEGISNFFGLDQASMRMGFDYGLGNNLTIGIGRSTFMKELDGFLKYRFVQQSKGSKSFPFSIVAVAGITSNTVKENAGSPKISFIDRTAYYYQLIIGRKFSEKFSFQISPEILHRNFAPLDEKNDVFAIAVGTRYKISKRMALVVDYSCKTSNAISNDIKNPLSIGIDIETGGHVFQLHFSNSLGMNERALLAETKNSWGKGEIQFGFNLSRVFTIKKRK